MANRDSGNFGNTGGNRENQGNRAPENPRGQTPGQDRGNMPGQPGQGGKQGDVRNQSEWEREQQKKNQNPGDPNRPATETDSDEEV